MIWFWIFTLYSFLGFLLEVLFARLTGSRPDRKCLMVLPLCPVYGLGACGILLLPAAVRARPLALFLLGGLTATATEYGAALWYERALHVSFWDYRGLPGSVQGRICLPFSLAWGLLALLLVYRIHPLLASALASIPVPVSLMAMATLLCDFLFSSLALRATGDRKVLRPLF